MCEPHSLPITTTQTLVLLYDSRTSPFVFQFISYETYRNHKKSGNSTGRSGAFTFLLTLDFKFVNYFQEKYCTSEYFKRAFPRFPQHMPYVFAFFGNSLECAWSNSGQIEQYIKKRNNSYPSVPTQKCPDST